MDDAPVFLPRYSGAGTCAKKPAFLFRDTNVPSYTHIISKLSSAIRRFLFVENALHLKYYKLILSRLDYLQNNVLQYGG